MNNKKFPPVAVCSRCGSYSHNPSTTNNRCSVMDGKQRCKGIYRSALAPGDWEVCPSCHGAEKTEYVRCNQCQSSGYIFVRK